MGSGKASASECRGVTVGKWHRIRIVLSSWSCFHFPVVVESIAPTTSSLVIRHSLCVFVPP